VAILVVSVSVITGAAMYLASPPRSYLASMKRRTVSDAAA
jgi:hypothetical protein